MRYMEDKRGQILRYVKVHARKLKGHRVLLCMDREDIEQELAVYALEAVDKYKKELGDFENYINSVLKRKSISLLRCVSRKKHGNLVPKIEYEDNSILCERQRDEYKKSFERVNLELAIMHLPKRLRHICELMRVYEISEIERLFGISNYKICRELERIKSLISCSSSVLVGYPSKIISREGNYNMKSLTILEELNIKELSRLESSDLKHISEQLQKLLGHAKVLKDKLEDSLHLKFYEKAKAHLAESDRGTGTSRFVDGSCTIVADLPKKVTWDQEIMDELCSKLPIDRMKDLVKVTYAIEEKKYSSWPDDTRKYFNAAREVSIGKTKFQILDGGEQ